LNIFLLLSIEVSIVKSTRPFSPIFTLNQTENPLRLRDAEVFIIFPFSLPFFACLDGATGKAQVLTDRQLEKT